MNIQVYEKAREKMKRKGQSLIEFVMIIPIFIVLIFGIIEYALFWRTTHAVQQIALESAVIATNEYVPTSGGANTVADKAADFVKSRVGTLGVGSITFTKTILDNAAEEPYAAYEYKAGTAPDGGPLVRFVVDYRNPVTRGVITQLSYYYRTIFFGMEFELPGGKKVVIIPNYIPISSTKIQQYNRY
ncbi:MAG: hypothetical protein ACD_20C00421G0003 [uncultured bacterium]|nr:MAG: hypothetical protein ACD_20C00421G0003 [uncultured bacterium]HBH18224.1 hypothetical protein [Cyanobacteria bacterium UBA9579]